MHWEKVTAETHERLWPYFMPCQLCGRQSGGLGVTALYLLTPEQGEHTATALAAVAGPHVLCDRCYKE